jgi:hypothetical protein
MRRKGSDLLWNLELQGGSSCLCWLRLMLVEPCWTNIWNVLTHTGHKESSNWVASCVDELDDTLPHFTGVQWDSIRATHGVSAEAYAWKTTLGWGRTCPGFLITLWIVATRGALLACVCCVIWFIPLQGWLLIQIFTTPSEIGDALFAVFKCRIINFIIM